MKTNVLIRHLVMASLCCLAGPAPASAQQSTATIGGQTWTLQSNVPVNALRASVAIDGAQYDMIPQTVGDPFSGISTAGSFTLVSGGASGFFGDRFDDYAIWARGEFADPGLASSQRGADKDGDGMTNEFEWLSLTDPENASSRLRLEVSLLDSAQIRIMLEPYFPAERLYSLERATDLTAGEFSTFDTDLGSASGSPPRAQQDVNIVPGSEPHRFFRARVLDRP